MLAIYVCKSFFFLNYAAVTSKNGLTQHNLTFQEAPKTDLHTYIGNILKMLTNNKFGCQLFRPY